MASIIVLQNGSADKALQTTRALSSNGSFQVTLIGESSDSSERNISQVVTDDQNSLSQNIWKILGASTSETALIVDSRVELTADTAEKLLSLHTESGAAATLPGFSCGVEQTDSGTFSVDQLSAILSPASSVALGVIILSKNTLTDIVPFEATSPQEFIGMLAVSAVGMHYAVNATDISLETETLVMAELVADTNTQKANILRHTINSLNIEELFPNHAWSVHGNECAAACYHTLSAQFIKLGDLDSALECLSLSDQLEDSPRSLALRGLIALGKGETLQAVANMVSSLQEYEKRKEDAEKAHYLTFTPRDLEKINTDLQSGLDALNKRDNSAALEFFSGAVFEFDSFYEDCGLSDIPLVVN
jgi:tetratricopeptide (TPR) repeat protein